MASAGLTPAQVAAYLDRIGHDPVDSPTASALASLQAAHLVAVPFENLHVHARLGVRVDAEWSFTKVVTDRRGGWCFELNGAFAELLTALGFVVERRSAQVVSPDTNTLGPPLDHLCLEVTAADGSAWLVDVGFGDSTLAPVPIPSGSQETASNSNPAGRLRRRHDGSLEYLEPVDRRWVMQYLVGPHTHDQIEFEERSRALQTPPGYFTEKPFATRALGPTGERVWLLKDRLKRRTVDGTITETAVAADEWPATLRHWFGIDPPGP